MDLIVIHLSCSSFLVSVALVSPALAEAMIPALDKSESVSVDLPWSTWAITDMFRILCFLSIMVRISSTVKFTLEKKVKKLQFRTFYHKMWNLLKWFQVRFVFFHPFSGQVCEFSSLTSQKSKRKWKISNWNCSQLKEIWMKLTKVQEIQIKRTILNEIREANDSKKSKTQKIF